MPVTNSDPDNGSHSTAKRSLPSWMSYKENRNKSQKKQNDASEIMPKNDVEDGTAVSYDAAQNNFEFSKLLDWILECYNQKKLVDIERYLMHVGKPWRRCAEQNQPKKVHGSVLFEEPIKRVEKRSLVMTGSASFEGGLPHSSNDHFLPSKIKEWAADDLRKTMSWLESQDEKPEASEIKRIAAEGIITCLQDAIESLKQNKEIKTVTQQWMFVPHIVKYLAELEGGGGNRNGFLPKKELYKVADSCREIYESELKQSNGSAKADEGCGDEPEDEGFDSDRTIEMTEEEIELACRQFVC